MESHAPPILNGDDFQLRALSPDDAIAWKAGEDEEQIRWFEAPGPAPLKNVIAAIDRWRAGWASGGPVHHWGIWADENLAGGVELRIRDDDRANISYLVFPAARRRGLATKAVRLATRWAFAELNITAVVAVIDERNVISQRVARSAGLVLDGPADPSEHGESGVMLRFVMTKPSDEIR
jgi:RimJ/RimL family protein N-acetyltransferase